MPWAPRRTLAIAGAAATLVACSLLVDTSDLDVGGSPHDASLEAGPDGPSGVEHDAALDAGSDAQDTSCPGAPEPGLLAWYPFDEADDSTVAVDCSGNGLDGRLLLATKPARAAGHTGMDKAMDFDGRATCFDVGLAPALAFSGEPRTVAAWLKPRTLSLGGNPRAFFSHVFVGTSRAGWWMATDEQSLLELKMFPVDAGFQEDEVSIPIDRWVHVAGVLVPNEMRVYVDGVLLKKTNPTKSAAVNPLAHGYLGCGSDGYFFDGLVDDLRLYARALTADEIAQLAAK